MGKHGFGFVWNGTGICDIGKIPYLVTKDGEFPMPDGKGGDYGIMNTKGVAIEGMEVDLWDTSADLGGREDIAEAVSDILEGFRASIDIDRLFHEEVDLSHLVESPDMVIM